MILLPHWLRKFSNGKFILINFFFSSKLCLPSSAPLGTCSQDIG